MRRGSLALLAWLALPLAAAAAESRENRKRPGRYQLGPLYVTPRLQLKNAGVDTNVFQTLSHPVRDEVLVLSPRLEGALPVGRRLRLTGMGLLETNYYRRQGEQRSTDFYGEGRGELDLGPFTLFGGGGGGQFTQRFSIDVDERLKRQEKQGYAGATWRVTNRLSATAQGRREIVTFAPGTFRLGGDVKEAMDRDTLAGTGQLRFALTNRTTLLASAETLEDRFFSQPIGGPRVRDSYRFLGGFELSTRAAISGKLLAGLREFPGTLAQGSPPYRGPIVSADVAVPLRPRARLHGIAERDVLYASSVVELGPQRFRNAFVYTRYQGEALMDLPWGLLGLASAGFEQSRYLLPYPFPDKLTLADRVDHRYTAGFSLVRRLGESVRVGGHVGWARRVSSLPFFSYQGVRYGLTAEVVP
ncbi:MAG TPA: outer membrane beta-barrel protein [Vicinamibacteria bacterium]